MTIKVKARSNVRDLDINGIDLDIRKSKEIIIIPRYLKSLEFKKYLFDGILRICEGSLEFRFKNVKCLINSTEPSSLLFERDGDMFVKDLNTGKIIPYIDNDEKEEVKEEDVEEDIF